MMGYSFGDVVLIGFPHSDYSRVSKRPALVIHDGKDQDLLLSRITSKSYSTETEFTENAQRPQRIYFIAQSASVRSLC